MKKNSSSSSRRKGFTLVELLIVIVVIGVLSAMMMLSSTEAVSSARASNIVSNLRNLKTAALAFYVDNIDSYDKASVTDNISSHREKILKYMGNNASGVDSAYQFAGKNSNTWYVYYTIGDDGAVKGKLAGRAKSTGLVGFSNAPTGDAGTTSGDYVAQDIVGMFIR